MICVMKRSLLPLIAVFAISAFAAPHISIQSPVAGASYPVGDTLHFHWTSLDTTVGGGCQIEISPDDGQNFYTLDDGTGHSPKDADWGNFDWVITDTLHTLNARGKQIKVYMVSSNLVIHIIDFYNKIQESQTYTSGVFSINAVAVERMPIRFGLNQSFTISPNPARGILSIRGAMDQVSLFDLSGKLLRTANMGDAGRAILNVEALPAGAYVVKAEVGKEFYSKKIIIEK